MTRRSFPLSEVYRLLEPGPVVLLTTSRRGKHNVMAMSWHTMMEFEPPLIGCVVSNRDYSFAALRATKECVLAIPSVEIVATVVKIGNTSGRDIDKFEKFKLRAEPAARVKAPLIAECFANIECKVVDMSLVHRYNFFVLEAKKAWIDPARKNSKTIHHRGMGEFMVAGKTIRLKSRMK